VYVSNTLFTANNYFQLHSNNAAYMEDMRNNFVRTGLKFQAHELNSEILSAWVKFRNFKRMS